MRKLEIPESFYEDELITAVLGVVKSGKEATVYCCAAHPSTGAEYLALKHYRPRRGRGFQDDSVYREGRVILDKRIRRAVGKKTRKGREAAFGMWIGHEVSVLQALHAAGADVPRVIAAEENAILMGFVGEGSVAAPPLYNVELTREEAPRLFEQLLRNLDLWLERGWVHADLSPYNILYHAGRLTVIDFPQAVDLHANQNAYALFQRDVEHVCEHFAQYGVRCDPARITRDLWRRTAYVRT